MIITANSPEVVALMQVWNSVDRRTEGLAEGLKRRLVHNVILPALAGFSGELILTYEEFLSRVPSGRHSFAHGSQMVLKTVYWVSVARLAEGDIKIVPRRGSLQKSSPKKITFSTPSIVLVPTIWNIGLRPRYRRNSLVPHFVRKDSCELDTGHIDVSSIGHHLFRIRRGELDWATKIEIAIGNESVGAWLRERKSAQTFNMLKRR